MNMTDLFPMHVNPVHVGVYEVTKVVDIGRFEFYQLWDGEEWKASSAYPDRAAKQTERSFDAYNAAVGWRGLITPQGE